MKIMILAYETADDFAKRDLKETDQAAFAEYMKPWYAYGEMLTKTGKFLSGAALEQPHTATMLSVRDGKRQVEDGPFADAKEQLGGYFIMDAPDMKTAQEWAAACPSSETGRTEVHVIPDYSEGA